MQFSIIKSFSFFLFLIHIKNKFSNCFLFSLLFHFLSFLKHTVSAYNAANSAYSGLTTYPLRKFFIIYNLFLFFFYSKFSPFFCSFYQLFSNFFFLRFFIITICVRVFSSFLSFLKFQPTMCVYYFAKLICLLAKNSLPVHRTIRSKFACSANHRHILFEPSSNLQCNFSSTFCRSKCKFINWQR